MITISWNSQNKEEYSLYARLAEHNIYIREYPVDLPLPVFLTRFCLIRHY